MQLPKNTFKTEGQGRSKDVLDSETPPVTEQKADPQGPAFKGVLICCLKQLPGFLVLSIPSKKKKKNVVSTIFTAYSCPNRWGEIGVSSGTASRIKQCKRHLVDGDPTPCHAKDVSNFWHGYGEKGE